MPCILRHISVKAIAKYIFMLLLLMWATTVFSQNANEWIEKGDEAMGEGFYKTALQQYNIALKFEKNNAKIMYKCAEAARLYNSYTEAIQWYENIMTLNAERQFPDIYYYLADMYKNTGNYKAAITNFEKYLDIRPPLSDKQFFDRATNEVASCEWALQNNKKIDSIKVKHLTNRVNTKNSESAAILMRDSLLLFTSLREFYSSKYGDDIIPDLLISSIYESKKEGDRYGVAYLSDWKFNSKKKSTANTCFDRINNRMYFTYCENDNFKNTKCNIYYSDLKNRKWTKPKKLGEEVNMPGYTATQPAVEVNDGKIVLYFVSDRPNGSGGLDIWYSIIENEKCSPAKNLGYPINTKGNEVTPFYDQNTKTLYFSSDYHYGFGGYDIFSSKGSFNEWSVPKNLGMPINSYANDLYYTVSEDVVSGYFTSNRVGSFYIDNNTCCNDIYEWSIKSKDTIHVDTAKALISTVEHKSRVDSLLPISLYFHNDEPDPRTQKLTTEKVYSDLFSSYEKMKDVYIRNYTKELSGNALKKAEEQINYFFENELKSNYQKLENFITYLLKDLKEGKSIRLVVRGYSSPLYTGAYNKNLSKRRISSFINQLLKTNEGVIAAYIDGENSKGGSLEIIELPLGSSTASSSVSSNPNDKRNSIYSVAAAKERRIEIISYTYQGSTTNSTTDESGINSSLVLGKELFLLGKIPNKKSIQLEIPVFNNSNKDQEIELLEVGCSCMKAYSGRIILPKQNGFILLDINTSKQEPGVYISPVTVKLRSENFSQTIFIEYQVEN